MTRPKAIDGIGPVPVGPIAYGCWRLGSEDPAGADQKIRTALDLGLTLIDTADVYGLDTPAGFGSAEATLGNVLSATPALRQQMVLATKGGVVPPTPYNSSEDYLITACEASLKRLKTDHIDLYQIHRPDLLAHPEDVCGALQKLQQDGKVSAFGVSNYSLPQIDALMAFSEVPIVSIQPEFSAWELGSVISGKLDRAMQYGLSCLAWSPLAGGALASGIPKDGDDILAFHRVIAVLDRIAEEHEATRSQVALSFLMRHPSRVIPIIGTQTIERMEEAANATKVALGRREWYDIFEARTGEKMP
ncbi:MAG: aldo/keto reductase [Parvularcula sp.]